MMVGGSIPPPSIELGVDMPERELVDIAGVECAARGADRVVDVVGRGAGHPPDLDAFGRVQHGMAPPAGTGGEPAADELPRLRQTEVRRSAEAHRAPSSTTGGHTVEGRSAGR